MKRNQTKRNETERNERNRSKRNETKCRFVSFDFVSFRFDRFRFVLFDFVSFRSVSFRFYIVSHFTGTLFVHIFVVRKTCIFLGVYSMGLSMFGLCLIKKGVRDCVKTVCSYGRW
jgi:hypothetical protein